MREQKDLIDELRSEVEDLGSQAKNEKFRADSNEQLVTDEREKIDKLKEEIATQCSETEKVFSLLFLSRTLCRNQQLRSKILIFSLTFH